MTIILTKPVRVGGVELAAATTQTLAADVEADLIARGWQSPTNPMLGGAVRRSMAEQPIDGASAFLDSAKTERHLNFVA